ncbi:MAG TPA: hypothetical protein VHE35_19995 [Kofleriaceae bacterium]|nr:hypothetical protein [Kofleriaceae bacterium]
MKLDKTCALFFGTKIDSKLREALSQSKPGDKKYFDGSSEEFLRVLETEEEKWIGKVIKAGPVVTEVDDIQRNIVSILRRVAPGARVSASGIKIFVLQGAAVGAAAGVIDDEGEDEDPASSGPYIAVDR